MLPIRICNRVRTIVRLRVRVGLGLWLEEVFVENRDRAVDAVESLSEARAY